MAVVMRWLVVEDVFVEGAVVPFDADSFYHLWRIESVVKHGVAPHWDGFANPPFGARVPYPDGLAWLLGGLVRLIHGAGADRHAIQVVSITACTLLGVAPCLVGYQTGRGLGHRSLGLVAAALIAVLPASVWPTMVGRVDHHVFEALLPALVLLALFPSQGRTPTSPARIMLAALALAGLGHTVTGAPLYVLVVGAVVYLHALRAVLRGTPAADTLRSAAWACLLAIVMLLPDSAQRTGFAYYEASWLTPLLLTALAITLAGLAAASHKGAKTFLTTSALAIVAAGALLFSVAGDAAGFIGRKGPMSLIGESQSAFIAPGLFFRYNAAIVVLVPLGIACLWRQAEARATAVALLATTALGLALLQLRFATLLAIPGALAAAAAIRWLFAQRRGGWLLALLLPTLLWPAFTFYRRSRVLGAGELAQLEAAEWLARETPPAGARTATEPPPYAILAEDSGNELAYLAERPTLGMAIYHGEFGDAWDDSFRLLYGSDDPAALVDKRRIRYLVLRAQHRADDVRKQTLVGTLPVSRPSVHGRLFDFDGAAIADARVAGGIIPALSRFRLVHESPVKTRRDRQTVPALKIFAVATPARIQGTCTDEVWSRVEVISDQNRRFWFGNTASCDFGRFDLTTPYPGNVQIGTRSTTAARTVVVSETDVREGRVITLDP